MANMKSLLTVTEAARRLAVSPNTVRAWADRGAIPVVRLPSGHRRFDVRELDAARELMRHSADAGTVELSHGAEDPRWRQQLERERTAAEWSRALANVKTLSRLREEVASIYGDPPPLDSVELIHQMREARTHELMRAAGWE